MAVAALEAANPANRRVVHVALVEVLVMHLALLHDPGAGGAVVALAAPVAADLRERPAPAAQPERVGRDDVAHVLPGLLLGLPHRQVRRDGRSLRGRRDEKADNERASREVLLHWVS